MADSQSQRLRPSLLACSTSPKFTSWSKKAVEAPAITSELQPAEEESGERACLLLLKASPEVVHKTWFTFNRLASTRQSHHWLSGRRKVLFILVAKVSAEA